jgi:hypothetical protein
MEAEYAFREWQENQRRTLERAVQAYRHYQDALKDCGALKGGMHWKKIRGREYLYQYRDRYGHGRSLGPRSTETEGIWAEFVRQRPAVTARRRTQRQRLAEAARFCRAALLHRVPGPVTRILRHLETGDLSGPPVMVIGTQALHAYEFAAGVFIDSPKTSPFWSGAASRLTLATAAELPPAEFLVRLRRADRSFQLLSGDDLAAINKTGFVVRLLRPPTIRSQLRLQGKPVLGSMVPAATGDLTALVSSPKFSQVVIGQRGDPVAMVVPDPRALALHKLWLSQQPERDPWRQPRDRLQAMALAELILRYLPQYHFFSAELRLFPTEVARQAEQLVEGYDLTPDLEVEY